MIGKYSLAGVTFTFAALAWASGAYSAPVYIGLQEAGVNGGAITQEATGSGTASITNLVYGNVTNGTFQLSVTATGTPGMPEPDLNTNSLSATASHPGTISIYVTELNQFPPPGFGDFQSIFGVGAISAGVTVVESTYMDECLPANSACGSSYIFDTAHLLSTATLTSTGSVTDFSSNGVPLTSTPIEETELLTITFTQQNTSTTDTIGLSVVPEPGSLGLFGAALAGLGFVRRCKV